jgi:hypothetical protein
MSFRSTAIICDDADNSIITTRIMKAMRTMIAANK